MTGSPLPRFAYVIAFRGALFIMVRHRDRAWEMPGGRLERGEDYEQAAKREFIEETGMELRTIGHIDVEGGKVFVGFAGCKVRSRLSPEIIEVREFAELPEDLSFPKVEYLAMLRRARHLAETFKRRKGISASASPLTRLEE